MSCCLWGSALECESAVFLLKASVCSLSLRVSHCVSGDSFLDSETVFSPHLSLGCCLWNARADELANWGIGD